MIDACITRRSLEKVEKKYLTGNREVRGSIPARDESLGELHFF